MKNLPDGNTDARHAWLEQLQQEPEAAGRASDDPLKSDFESSTAWRGVFVAAFIVIAVNVPLSPTPAHTDVSTAQPPTAASAAGLRPMV
jgi:hypothetical protein